MKILSFFPSEVIVQVFEGMINKRNSSAAILNVRSQINDARVQKTSLQFLKLTAFSFRRLGGSELFSKNLISTDAVDLCLHIS